MGPPSQYPLLQFAELGLSVREFKLQQLTNSVGVKTERIHRIEELDMSYD